MAIASKQFAAKDSNNIDAISLLKTDHDKVSDLFKQFDELMDDDGSEKEKGEIVLQVCNALKVHAQIEDEIFYPAVRAAINDDNLMDEATSEHQAIQDLIVQIEAMEPSDVLYDAKVVVLGEEVERHVQEEESEMFPLVETSSIDKIKLGMQLMKRKMELISEMGESDESEHAGVSHTAKKRNKSTHSKPLS